MTLINDKLKKLDSEIILNAKKIALLKYQGLDRMISSEEKQKIILEEAKGGGVKIKTSIPALDGLFDGFRLGTVNVISGPTGEGKTTFLQTLTHNFWQEGVKCAWFPFEGIDSEFFEKFPELPTFYLPKEIPDGGNSMAWIKDRIIESQVKYETQVVFIDHLHYLQDMQSVSGKDQLSLYIGDLMRKLKKFAMEAGVVVFLIVHVKSDAGVVNSRHIYYTKDDIRDSSFVKQEADSVMMIYRARKKTDLKASGWEYTTEAVLNVDKNRRTGKVDFIDLIFQNGRFFELERRLG